MALTRVWQRILHHQALCDCFIFCVVASNKEQLCCTCCPRLAEQRGSMKCSAGVTQQGCPGQESKGRVGIPNLMQFWRDLCKSKTGSAEATPNAARGCGRAHRHISHTKCHLPRAHRHISDTKCHLPKLPTRLPRARHAFT